MPGINTHTHTHTQAVKHILRVCVTVVLFYGSSRLCIEQVALIWRGNSEPEMVR